jgi:hypothetical protein
MSHFTSADFIMGLFIGAGLAMVGCVALVFYAARWFKRDDLEAIRRDDPL